MPDKLDMGLDDIIKQGKSPRGARGGARGTRGGGGIRRGAAGGGGGLRPRGAGVGGGNFMRRGGAASAAIGGIRKRRSGGPIKPNTFKSAARLTGDEKWKHDLYEQGPRRTSGGGGAIGVGLTRIQITNLDYGVNDKDIKDLFEEFGIRKAAVHYDRTGRSLGTADVLFEKKADALRAIKEYNGVQLDGRPMNIQLATSNSAPSSAASVGGGVPRNGASAGATRRFGGRSIRGGGRGRGRGGRGGGGMGSRINKGPSKTKEQLDADLDTYTSMQTD